VGVGGPPALAVAGRRDYSVVQATASPPHYLTTRPAMFDLLIRNGRVVDGTGLPWFRADVGVTGDRIAAVGRLDAAAAKLTLDAAGKVVCPGFVDAHVHGDLALLADPVHEPAVRQGVTTYVLGQDGVAFAPGSPDTQRYMRQYTAGFNG